MALAYTSGQTLWSYSNTTDNSSATTARFIDLDGDGDLDIFIGVEKAAGNQPSQIWKNDGAGNFNLHQSLPAARIVQSWLVNLDADPELELVTRSYQSPLQIWQNNGSGTFTAGGTIGSGVQTADIADLDGDGDLDAFVGIFQGNYAVYKNNGSGAFTLSSSPAKVSDPQVATLVDLDRDGDKDAVVVEDNAVRILTNNGSGVFTQHSSFGDAFGGAALSADLTGDGHADALVSGVNGASANLTLFQNNGSGALGTQLHAFTRAEAPNAFADVDGDGDLDGLGQKIMLNNGAGAFSDSGVVLQDPAFMYQGSPVTGRALAAGDVDGDGDTDVAVAFYAGDWTVPLYAGAVKLYLNNAVPATNADGTLTAGTGVSEPVGLPSSADTAAEAVDVFDFKLTDGGGSDGLALGVSQLKVHTSGTGDFSKVTWRLSGPDATNVVGTYNAGTNEITFAGLAISVANGGNETYKVSGFYNNRTGLTDGQTYILSIDGDTDLTLATGGTRMASGQAAVNNGAGSTVSVVNESPTNIALSPTSVAENTSTAMPLTIGALTTTDVNAGDSFTYSIVGGADAGLFAISGGNLQFRAGTVLDHEAQASYAVTVRSTDAGSLSVDKAFTVTLTNVNEAPTVATPLPDQAAQATQAFSFAFASSAFADVDAATTLTYTATLDGGGALPGWLSFNPGTRTFSGTPAVGDAGTLQVKVTASDGSLSASDTFALVVTAAPSVSSIVRTGGSALTNATSVDYTVTFSQPVSGVDTSDFTATGVGATGSVAGISGSGSTYTVTVGSVSGDGTLRLDLNGSGTGIQNGLGMAITGGYTAGEAYTIDTVAPAASSPPDLDTASDTGASSTDNITSTITPTFTGTAGLNADVTLYDTDGTSVLGSTTADGAGNWSITSIAMATGAHTLTTKASDAAGNSSAASLSLSVTIDPTAPAFASATVNGNQLVLTCTDAGTLDAVNAPAPGSFTVMVGATPNVVTAAVVNAAAKTVTLTLTTAVTNGQVVTVAYADPSGANDANAIQDAAGNDAATLVATAVTNTTPAPDPGPGRPPATPIDGVPVTT
ncbi:putative Ig domain-containing protein, partial [Acidovorax sp. CF316]|uniref:FG-GAP-like repeat-containing protein n=1 Tax=Acidovorax sp. CF316 TaxID=1144317 RepID=UPI00026BD022